MDADTLALLGDCTAGIEMAVTAMDGVLLKVKDQVLRRKLQDSIRAHEDLRAQSLSLLQQWGGQEKHPSPVSLSLSRLKAETRLAWRRDDPTAAEVVADNCDLGIRRVCRSKNRHTGADQAAQFLADQLIACEENLSSALRSFL